MRGRLEQLRGQFLQWGTPDLRVFVITKDELRGWIRALEWILGGVGESTTFQGRTPHRTVAQAKSQAFQRGFSLMADGDYESGDSKPPVNQGNFLATAIEHQEEVSGLVKSIADAVVDALVRVAETQNKHERKLAYVVATVLLVIIGTGAGLTWAGKLDAVAFAFLVGPIVGGLITYLVQSLAPVSMFDVG